MRRPGLIESVVAWFSGLTPTAKVSLALLLLLLAWLIGIAIPATVVNALQSSAAIVPAAPRVAIASASNSVAPVALALANPPVVEEPPAPTATYTPPPTLTPIPTETPTATPIPTETPVPTEAPTETPIPTLIPTNTPVPPPAAPKVQSAPCG